MGWIHLLLAIDIGNTQTVFGLFAPGEHACRHIWRSATRRDRTAHEWAAFLLPMLTLVGLSPADVSGVAISSVVPSLTAAMSDLSRSLTGAPAVVVTAELDLGITLDVETPGEVGADRLANSAAAFSEFGGPIVVIDLGTASKIEAITADGRYVGGVIAPGLGLSMEALASRAARLYAVELRFVEKAIGVATIDSVQSGVVLGHAEMIAGMTRRVRDELGGVERVILTGGYGSVLAAALPFVTNVEPELTLRGLRLIHARNRGRSAVAT